LYLRAEGEAMSVVAQFIGKTVPDKSGNYKNLGVKGFQDAQK